MKWCRGERETGYMREREEEEMLKRQGEKTYNYVYLEHAIVKGGLVESKRQDK